MAYDSRLDGLLAMSIAMQTGKASEALEIVQHAEQEHARSSCMLPKNMKPSKSNFEELGFRFEDTGDEVLYKATMPDGWTLESNGGYWTNLVDEKGRKRGSYFYKGAFYDRRGSMSLNKRFSATYEHSIDEDYESPVNVFAQDIDGTILFDAGQCNRAYSDEFFVLLSQVRNYLDSNFPGWEDVGKYWD